MPKQAMKSQRWERTLRDSLMIERCVYLDERGHQCRKFAEYVTWYHGNEELYDYPNWVRAAFCKTHSKEHK